MKTISLMTIILFIFLNSCQDPFWLEEKKKKNEKDKTLEFKEIFNSNHHYHNELSSRMTFVAKSKEEENEIYEHVSWLLAIPQQFPEIDYDSKMLLCIVLPPQSSGSYELKVTDVVLKSERIEVSSELRIQEIATTDIGYPIVFVEVDKYDYEVEFLETKVVQQTLDLSNLINNYYELESMIDKDGEVVDPNFYRRADSQWQRVDLEPFTIRFDENNKLSGLSNCNNYNGDYEINNSELKINNLSFTEVACPFSDLYHTLLIYAVKIDYSDPDRLIIYSKINNDNYVLNYQKFNPEEKYDLKNTRWKFIAWSDNGGEEFNQGTFINNNGDEEYFSQSQFYIVFGKDKAQGNANCETFVTNYNYNVFENTLNFNKVFINSNCGGEETFIELLNSSTSFKYKNNSIILYNQDKSKAMLFEREYPIKSNEFIIFTDTEYFLEAYGHYYDEYYIDYDGSFSSQSLFLNSDNSVSGSVECNDYIGDYQKIQLGEINFNVNLVTDDVCQNEYKPNFKYDYINFFNNVTNYFTRNEGKFLHIYFESSNPEELNYMMFVKQ